MQIGKVGQLSGCEWQAVLFLLPSFPTEIQGGGFLHAGVRSQQDYKPETNRGKEKVTLASLGNLHFQVVVVFKSLLKMIGSTRAPGPHMDLF